MKRVSLLTKVFAAFAVSVLVPLGVMLSYTNAALMQTFEQEISKAALGKLKIAGNVGGMIFESLETTGMRIAVDPRLVVLAEQRSLAGLLEDSAGIFAAMELQNLLSDLTRTNSLYDSIELIPARADFTMSSTRGTAPKDDETLESADGPRVVPRPDPNEPGTRLLSYVYPLTPYISPMQGAVVINIREEVFARRINADNGAGEGVVSLVDAQGRVLSDIDKTMLYTGASAPGLADATGAERDKAPSAKGQALREAVATILRGQENEGSFTVPGTGGAREVLSFLKKPERGLAFVGRFSLDTMGRSLETLRNNTVVASVILILMALACSWILSQRLAHPVRKLAQDIRRNGLLDDGTDGNEIHLISRAFETLERRETQLFSLAERNRNRAEQARLLALLEGQAGDAPDDDVSGPFPLPYCACAVLSIDGAKSFADSHPAERQYYLKSLVLGMAEEAFYPDAARGVIVDGSRIALVLNSGGSGEAWEKSMAERFETLKRQSAKILGTSISMSLSRSETGASQMACLYQEAQNLVKLRFLRGHGSFIGSGVQTGSGYFYPHATERKLLAALESADKADVQDSVRELIAQLSSSRELSYDSVMLILNVFAGSIVRFLIDRHVRIADVFGAGFNVYAGLAENETLEETGHWFASILLRVVEFFDDRAAAPQSPKGKILDYVRSNYTKGFDINMIADSVGLSYSHVRKVFHDNYGENILVYVNNLRIAEAKRLLRETTMHVNDIALSLGYNNTQSFTRYFKKFVRLTPGAYRTKEYDNVETASRSTAMLG